MALANSLLEIRWYLHKLHMNARWCTVCLRICYILRDNSARTRGYTAVPFSKTLNF